MATLNYILDGSIEEWASGAPANQNTQTTNTTLLQLTRDMKLQFHPASRVMRNALGHWEPLVKDGHSALRATIAAAGAADEFRIWGPGAAHLVALTGECTAPLLVQARTPDRFYFTFWARCDVAGNQLRVRLYARSAADAILGSFCGSTSPTQTQTGLQPNTLRYVDGASDYNVVELFPKWRQYSFQFECPPHEASTGVEIEHVVWQISNNSAGAQNIDLDAIEAGTLLKREEA